MRVGVIDLGTNTFNLLIADVQGSDFQLIHNSKIGVALGMGGINDRLITPEAQDRAIQAFEEFSQLAEKFQVEKIIGIGTSALRDASNGVEFSAHLSERFQIPIRIIDGLQEAEFIFQGVSWNLQETEPYVIMDIGGGSTEFIRVEAGRITHVCSLNIGVSRAVQKFQLSDPLSESDKQQLLDWFEQAGTELEAFPPTSLLVGASGSFETFYEMIHQLEFPTGMQLIQLDKASLHDELDWILASTQEQREQHPFIIPIRRRMAPIAALKTEWVLDKLGIKRVIISSSSLKEGVLRLISEGKF
ncbi:MAG: hypothetical protein ACOVO3_02120 [Fluviicola sp.]